MTATSANHKLTAGRFRRASNPRFQHIPGPRLRVRYHHDGIYHNRLCPATYLRLGPISTRLLHPEPH